MASKGNGAVQTSDFQLLINLTPILVDTARPETAFIHSEDVEGIVNCGARL
jgi:hypothetical protein